MSPPPPHPTKGIPRRATATLTYCATFPRRRLPALLEPLYKTKKAFVSCGPPDGSVPGGSQKRPDVWYSRESWHGARGGVVGEKEKLWENGGERGKEGRGGESGLVFQEKALLLLAVVLQGDTAATEDHFTCLMQAHWCSMTKQLPSGWGGLGGGVHNWGKDWLFFFFFFNQEARVYANMLSLTSIKHLRLINTCCLVVYTVQTVMLWETVALFFP